MPLDTPSILVRHETPDDVSAIRALTEDAFGNSEFGHNGEANLIDALRDSSPILSLVAHTDTDVVGHILFTPVTMQTRAGNQYGIGWAPMSVAPHKQRQGIGSLLITSGIAQLSAENCPFVVVLGHPKYYPKFGFAPASDLGITHGFTGIPQDVFFIRVLESSTDFEMDDGLAFYESTFGPQNIGT